MTTAIKNRLSADARYLIRYWTKGDRKPVDAEVRTLHTGYRSDSWADCEMTAFRQIAFQAEARRIEVHGPDFVDVHVRTKSGEYERAWFTKNLDGEYVQQGR